METDDGRKKKLSTVVHWQDQQGERKEVFKEAQVKECSNLKLLILPLNLQMLHSEPLAQNANTFVPSLRWKQPPQLDGPQRAKAIKEEEENRKQSKEKKIP